MYCNVTRRIQAGVDRMWQEAAISGQLAGATSVKEYLSVLRDHRNWNDLSFSLRRYLYLRFTQRSVEEEPVSYSVSFAGKCYDFSPVTPEAELSAQERKDYAELLYRITLHSGCFKRDKQGRVNPKEGAISKQAFEGYLSGRQMMRNNLFPLSVALGFDRDTLAQFMNVLGESPVYNFRDAKECIYCFCQNVPSLHTWETVEELVSYYERLPENADAPFVGAGMTEQLSYEIEEIAGDEELTDLERKEVFKRFLAENRSQFVQYSRTARELLTKELNNTALLDTRTILGERSGLAGAFVCVEDADDLMTDPGYEGQNVFDELFARLYQEKCGKPLLMGALDLDRRMKKNLTDSAHLREVYGGAWSSLNFEETMGKPVLRQDFLLVRLKKFDVLIKKYSYTPEERLELMKRFRASTDRILDLAGLPGIYVGNPLDHMILTALCQPDPAEFTRELYFRATEEGAE